MNQRKPPYLPDAERSVVGALLVRPDLLPDVLDTGLRPEHFYRPAWGAAFAAILDLARRGEAVDTVTIDDALGADGPRPTSNDLLEATGSTLPSSAHAMTYARRIVDYARLRRILGALVELTEGVYGDAAKKDVDGFADVCERILLGATARRVEHSGAPRLLAEVLDAALVELRTRSAGELRGVPSGFVDLDARTGGFRPGQLVVLGARPSHGKSALALDVALHAARHAGPVLFVAVEMSALELAGGGQAPLPATPRRHR
jgi:replicative DNA helicase